MTLLLLALLTVGVLVLLRIAASPTFFLLSLLFGSWAERCRHGTDMVEDPLAS
jgi:hypothetical protein